MKKTILIVSLFMLIIIGCGGHQATIQDKDSSNFTFIKDNLNLNRDNLFEKLNIWIAQNYNSSKTVIQYSNKETGNLVLKGIFTMESVDCNYTLTVETSDNKQIFKFKDFKPEDFDPKYLSSEFYKSSNSYFNKMVNDIVKSYY